MTRNIILSSFVLTLAAGCAPDGTDPDMNRGTVTGRVERAARRDVVQGAAVTVFRVETDGSLTQVSDGMATTDANGEYAVDVSFDDGVDAMTDLVVLATADGDYEGHVIVSSTLEVDGAVQAAPIDDETSTEARVFLELKSDGSWDDQSMSTGLLRTMIGTDVSAAMATTTDADEGDLDVYADATLAAMTAWFETAQSDATSTGDQASALASIDAAIRAYDQAAADSGADAAAHADLQTAFDVAWESAGYTSGDIALMGHASAEAAGTFTTDLSSDARDAADYELGWTRARLAATAVIDASDALGLSTAAMAEIADAWSDYEDDASGLLDLGLDVDTQLMVLSETWNASVLGTVESDLDVTTWLVVQGAVTDAETASADLETELDSTTTTDATVAGEVTADAMADFATTIESSASVDAIADTSLGESGAVAMSEILVQLGADGSLATAR